MAGSGIVQVTSSGFTQPEGFSSAVLPIHSHCPDRANTRTCVPLLTEPSCALEPFGSANTTAGSGIVLRARILAIACGYEDADDLDHLRTDPAFK
ncbi:MAG: hypothetical protein ACJ8AI_24470, partial [Rhodopila sp.]